jgi:spore maturation protein CgeB
MPEKTTSNPANVYLTIPGASITGNERQYLKSLAEMSARSNQNALIVNIGCWQGATLACFRAGAPYARIIGVDIDFTTQELLFTDFEQLHGDSREVHTQVPDNIDLLFIDGDHHYEVVREDIANWVPKVRPGGTVVFHDYTPTPLHMKVQPHLADVCRAVGEWADALGDGWEMMAAPDSLRAYHNLDANGDKRALRVSLIYPGHSISTIDVAKGYEAALRELGCNVFPYPYHNSLVFYSHALEYWAELNPWFQYSEEDWLREASYRVIPEILRSMPDVVIIICGFALHKEAYLMMSKALGLPVVLLLTESPYADMRIGHKPGQRHLIEQGGVSLAFTNERNSVGYLSETGVPVVYLPHSYDPERHWRRDVGPDYESDVFFCGSMYQERQELIGAIDWTGIDDRIVGPTQGDREVKGGMPNEEVVKHYSGTKIALNIHRTSCGVFDEELIQIMPGQVWSLGPRSYEIAACGAFQISDGSRGELYEVFGDTVPTYNTAGECEALIRRYLADDIARKDIAQLQHEAAEPCTFRARAAEILLPAIRAEVL